MIEDANSFKGVQKEEVIISQTTDQNMIIYLFTLLLFSTGRDKSQALGS